MPAERDGTLLHFWYTIAYIAVAEPRTEMITAVDQIQLAMPSGVEDEMRAFYCDLLGMAEVAKPPSLLGAGGFWAQAGSMQVHFGVDPQFTPARKAHPAFIVDDLGGLTSRLDRARLPFQWDARLPGVRRLFLHDPVGNRIELIASD